MARCTFCSASIDAPPGVAVRCASCGNLTTTPSIPQTMPAQVAFPLPPAPPTSSLPFARVDAPKQSASPPPVIVMPSRAGGVDELVGGGITILGISLLKLVLLGMAGLFFTCILGMLGWSFHG